MENLPKNELKEAFNLDINSAFQILENQLSEIDKLKYNWLLLKSKHVDLMKLSATKRLPLLKNFKSQVFAYIDQLAVKPKVEKSATKKNEPKVEKQNKQHNKKRPSTSKNSDKFSIDELLEFSETLNEDFCPEGGDKVIKICTEQNQRLKKLLEKLDNPYDENKVGDVLFDFCNSIRKLYFFYYEKTNKYEFSQCESVKLALRLVEKSGDAEYAKQVLGNYSIFRKYTNKFIPILQTMRNLLLKCFEKYDGVVDGAISRHAIQRFYKWEDFMLDFVMQYDKAAKRMSLQTDNPVEIDDEQIDSINIEDLLQGVGSKKTPKTDDGQIDMDEKLDEIAVIIEKGLEQTSKAIKRADNEGSQSLKKLRQFLVSTVDNGQYSEIDAILELGKDEFDTKVDGVELDQIFEEARVNINFLRGIIELMDYLGEKNKIRLKGVFKSYKSKLGLHKTTSEIQIIMDKMYDYCDRVNKPKSFAETSYLFELLNMLLTLKID